MSNCQGYCRKCEKIHTLGVGNSRHYALELFHKLEIEKRIDFDLPITKADSRFSNECLYSEFRGQMFGVLECKDINDNTVILKAFSCQHNGIWNCEGWVPPLLDVEKFYQVMTPAEKEIKNLCQQINIFPKHHPERLKIHAVRKKISQKLMEDIFALYSFTNFRGNTVSIKEAFCFAKGIPTGTGDCCAPKLLDYAARNNLKPVGISEFFFGRESKSGNRQHGEFYPSCEIKCAPILGFMLCGIEDL